MSNLQIGIVYTETIIWAPPERFSADAPYQLAIIEFPEGKRITARIKGDQVSIGDEVSFVESRDGTSFFQKSKAA